MIKYKLFLFILETVTSTVTSTCTVQCAYTICKYTLIVMYVKTVHRHKMCYFVHKLQLRIDDSSIVFETSQSINETLIV
jgi:hypothetical protein